MAHNRVRLLFFLAALAVVCLLWRRTYAQVSTQRPAWEYQTVWVNQLTDRDLLQEFNRLGGEGWELVLSHRRPDDITLTNGCYIFKRRK